MWQVRLADVALEEACAVEGQAVHLHVRQQQQQQQRQHKWERLASVAFYVEGQPIHLHAAAAAAAAAAWLEPNAHSSATYPTSNITVSWYSAGLQQLQLKAHAE
jgi:hypothetical protein